MKNGLKKAYEITDAKIQFVSLVDKAANKRQFLLKKEDGGKATFTTYGRIVKTNAENHYVTGVVYEPMSEDSHGNFMTEDEITKAAYWFAKNGDKVDLQHSFEPLDGATVVENWIAKADFEIDGEVIKKGTWLMTVEVSDESVWEGIEKGEITGFSMGGLGNYSEEDINLDSVNKQETSEKKGLLKQLAGLFGLDVVEKGEVKERYEQNAKRDSFWNAFYALQNTLLKYDWSSDSGKFETDEAVIREALTEFSEIIMDVLAAPNIMKALAKNAPVEKAGKKISCKNRETLNDIYESLGAFLKEFDDPEDDDPNKKKKKDDVTDKENDDKSKTDKEEKEVTKQEVEQIVSAAITKALGDNAQPQVAPAEPEIAGAVEKDAGNNNTVTTEITPEAIQKMVEVAIEKAIKPQEEHVTAEQVQEMISAAVVKAVDPVLKSKALPSNLNGNGLEKSAGETHYLHGIL